ncbi:MAG: hypothetical protein M3P23_11895 [Actinomycetota bacterium]|nr:hypothetical protein [Actinomycetota bacterium]
MRQGVATQVLGVALSPNTSIDRAGDALDHVDGVLVMLLEPGTTGRADLSLLAKVRAASDIASVGVDGGVGESNLARLLSAGASYVVVGRRLFSNGTAAGSDALK